MMYNLLRTPKLFFRILRGHSPFPLSGYASSRFYLLATVTAIVVKLTLNSPDGSTLQ